MQPGQGFFVQLFLIGAHNRPQRKIKKRVSWEASKVLSVVNAFWRKKAMLQILIDWRSCPVGLLFEDIGHVEWIGWNSHGWLVFLRL